MILKFIKCSFFLLIMSVNAQQETIDTLSTNNKVVDSISTKLESSLEVKKDTVSYSEIKVSPIIDSDSIIKDSSQLAFFLFN